MVATATPTALTEIERLTKEFAAARDVLGERVSSFQEEIAAIRSRRMTGIKLAVANAKEAHSKLEQALSAHRSLFAEPRSITVHGIKVGIVKAKGKIEWEDAARVVELIEKNFPEKVKVLVKTTKKPVRKALAGLTVAELKKIGCTSTAAGDVVLIKAVDDEVDKLVAALLDEGAEDSDDEE